ncbi:MAG TPA: serine/threonine-protein kinase PknK, partial [Leptospiraceae bacterium]|nr:serine/threonine-protein kinase PknK [Leptospiraceae bacterium]
RVFDITNQLNVAKELLIENSKKLLLAELILQSAKKVKSSTAYSSALLYINQCKSLLDESAWINHYNIISDMYIEMAEIYYLNGDLEKSVDFINDSLNKVKTNIEKGELYNL